jgi:hypothetical protein
MITITITIPEWIIWSAAFAVTALLAVRIVNWRANTNLAREYARQRAEQRVGSIASAAIAESLRAQEEN